MAEIPLRGSTAPVFRRWISSRVPYVALELGLPELVEPDLELEVINSQGRESPDRVSVQISVDVVSLKRD